MVRKLSVSITGSGHRLEFSKPLDVSGCPLVRIKRVKVFWEYSNSDGTFGYTFGNFNIRRNLFRGYNTFADISAMMKKDGITLSAVKPSRKCWLNKPVTMDKGLKELLGYTVNTPNGLSQLPVNINRGLRLIKIRCGSLNREKNINEKGEMDRILLTIPITTEQTLNGSVGDHYVSCVAELDGGVHPYFDFEVTDQDDNPVDIGTISLDMYLQ